MTKDEAMELFDKVIKYAPSEVRITDFAKLVAEREREACARVCEDGINNATDWDSSVWDQACENRAFAIRARGQA
jgi:hypothetical protein